MINRIDAFSVGLLNKLCYDYIQESDFLQFAYNRSHKLESYPAQIAEKKKNYPAYHRMQLVNAMRTKYQELGISEKQAPKVFQNLKALESENTFTVTTGHQLVLFGGPLFTTYKILTAVKLAEELSAQSTENKVVPVLWLASEDHDFEEIARFFVKDTWLNWELPHQGEAVGRLRIANLEPLIQQVQELLPDNHASRRLIQLIKSCYKEGELLANASFRFFHEYFKDLGLLVLDPDNPELKSLFRPIMEKDLATSTHFQVQQEGDKQLAAHYDLQINARACNLFLLDEAGKRNLLKKDSSGNSFSLSDSDQNFDLNNLLEILKSNPERFSPNVNLRPLYQECVLPNLAYVGGPAEIAYWLQLKPLFDANALCYPIPVLRHMQVIFPPGLNKRLEEMQLNPQDILLPLSKLEALFYEKQGDTEVPLLAEQILESWQRIYEEMTKVDGELSHETLQDKLEDKQELKELVKKYQQLRRKKHESKLLKLEGWRKELFPGGILQERNLILPEMEALYDSFWAARILDFVKPFEKGMLLEFC